MKIKKTLIIIAFCQLLTLHVSAQRLINGDRVSMYYSLFPTNYELLDKYQTFNADISGVKYSNAFMKSMIMPGFRMVGKDSVGDFTIKVQELVSTVSKPKLVTSNGGDKTNYSYSSTISIKYRVKLIINNVTIDSVIRNRKKDYEAKSSYVAKTAKSQYNKTIYKEMNAVINSTFTSAFGQIQKKYCFTRDDVYCSFLTFKNKKHNFKPLNQSNTESTKLLRIKRTDENKEIIRETIKLNMKELSFYEPENKKARVNEKLKAGLLYNIGVGYFYLKEYKKAYEYLGLATEIKKQIQNGQPKIFEAAKNNSTHTRDN